MTASILILPVVCREPPERVAARNRRADRENAQHCRWELTGDGAAALLSQMIEDRGSRNG